MKTFCKLTLGLVVLASVSNLVAQTPTAKPQEDALGIVYKFTSGAKKDQPSVSKSCFTILQVRGDQGVFADYARYQLDSISAQPNVSDKLVGEYAMRMNKAAEFFEPVIYDAPRAMPVKRGKSQKNAGQKLCVLDAIVTDRFSYEEQILYKWELGDEERVIGEYTCNRAVLHYGGREWVAWYAPDLPINQGPWKLKGLPGLILSAETTDGAFRFDLASIYPNLGFAMSPQASKKHIPADRKSFIARRNQIMEDPLKNTPTAAITSITVLKHDDESGSYLINDIRVPNLAKGEYVPMELN